MSKIYIMFVDESSHAVDWITYCRAHMMREPERSWLTLIGVEEI